jgi:hypothetical protein
MEGLAQKPLGGAEKVETKGGFNWPKFHVGLTQGVLTFIAFAVGALTIPNYYANIEAFTAGLILAVPTFIIVGFLKK